MIELFIINIIIVLRDIALLVLEKYSGERTMEHVEGPDIRRQTQASLRSCRNWLTLSNLLNVPEPGCSAMSVTL